MLVMNLLQLSVELNYDGSFGCFSLYFWVHDGIIYGCMLFTGCSKLHKDVCFGFGITKAGINLCDDDAGSFGYFNSHFRVCDGIDGLYDVYKVFEVAWRFSF